MDCSGEKAVRSVRGAYKQGESKLKKDVVSAEVSIA